MLVAKSWLEHPENGWKMWNTKTRPADAVTPGLTVPEVAPSGLYTEKYILACDVPLTMGSPCTFERKSCVDKEPFRAPPKICVANSLRQKKARALHAYR